MRHPPILAGLLLALAWVSPARAQGVDCATVLGVDPISQYVRTVVERVDAGLGNAEGEGGVGDFDLYFPDWLRTITQAVLLTADTRQAITEEQDDLQGSTSCLRLDQLILQCKQEEVREALNQALADGAPFRIGMLEELHFFLEERRLHLELGAHNPLYVDPDIGERHSFDSEEQGFCCVNSDEDAEEPVCEARSQADCPDEDFYLSGDQCDEECFVLGPSDGESDEVCPYSSRYGPGTEDTGCNLEVMSSRTAYLPFDAEYTALLELTQAVADLTTLAEDEGLVTTGEEPAEDIEGCAAVEGYCAVRPDVPCQTSADCESFAEGVDIEGFELPTELTACIRGEPEPLPAMERRGPFHFEPDHIGILYRFADLWGAQGAARPWQSDLRVPSEFPDDESEEAQERALDSTYDQFLRGDIRQNRRLYQREQGLADGQIYPVVDEGMGEDPDEEDSGLEDAVAAFAEMTSGKNGIRSLVRRFAYFLRRTCMDFACNERLESIMRIAFADECFPYADGTYLDACESGPSTAQACADAAGVDAGTAPGC